VKSKESLNENQIRTLETVTGIDQVVGKLIRKLEEQGELDNTIIVFTSDHGILHGEFGLGGKTLLYDVDLKIPLVIYAPGLDQQRVVEEMSLNIDLGPTLLDMAGVAIPEQMQGKSLKPLIENKGVPWRTDFFSENLFMEQNYPRTEAVRTKDWKYIRYFSKEKDQHHILSLVSPMLGEQPIYEELYDLKNDPNEEKNLAAQPDKQELLEQFRDRCAALLIEAKGGNELPKTYIVEFDDREFRDSVEVIYKKLKLE
jgi:arylsulfatase A-like enzyme